jgi:hypothetical protein
MPTHDNTQDPPPGEPADGTPEVENAGGKVRTSHESSIKHTPKDDSAPDSKSKVEPPPPPLV